MKKKFVEWAKQTILFFFPTKAIKFISILLLVISLIMIFAPPISRKAPYFNADNYYDLIGGIIGGLITIYALLLQLTNENESKHKEERVNARGYFEINYTNKLDKKLERCVAKTKLINKRNKTVQKYLILKLHGDKCIFNCYIKLDTVCSDERFSQKDVASIGLIVPEQTIAIPVTINHKNSKLLKYTNKIAILYNTTMTEVIKYELEFELEFENWVTNPANRESMYYLQSKNNEPIIIDESNWEKIMSDSKYKAIFESQSTLFEYGGMV